jgi:GntR family transcriptional repressor for pyruvate dehydrogenase complex
MTPRAAQPHNGRFSPLPVRTPADQVRLSILEAIISGQLRPGDRLPGEQEQARGFNVSRAVVREALRALSQVGLVVTSQGRGGGSFVSRLETGPVERSLREAIELMLQFDSINVAEVADARRALERTCAGLAATRRTERDVAAIAAVLDRAADSSLDMDRWLDLDIDFHRGVVRSAHNRVLAVPLAALHAVVQPNLNQAIVPNLDRPRVNAQHRAIHQAIADHDAVGAQQAIDGHLDYLEALYRRAGVLPKSRGSHS